jgi:hypothetical protein
MRILQYRRMNIANSEVELDGQATFVYDTKWYAISLARKVKDKVEAGTLSLYGYGYPDQQNSGEALGVLTYPRTLLCTFSMLHLCK